MMDEDDCKIDDVELITDGHIKKIKLGTRQSPVGLLNIIIAKWKEGGQSIRTDISWETKDTVTQKPIWWWRVGILGHSV